MPENNELYDHLSAARIVYQDSFENELDIIRELKIYLIESQFSMLDNNQILSNFYQYINIPVTHETISNVSISPDSQVNNLVQIMFISNDIMSYLNNHVNNNQDEVDNNYNNNDEDVENDDEIIYDSNNIQNSNLINILNTIIVNLNNNEINNIDVHSNASTYQNVIATVEDDDFNKLESQILTCDHDSNCSICMSQMVKDDKIILLNCSHNFHYDCIAPYLKEYNYKCPVCRAEVGKAKYNI